MSHLLDLFMSILFFPFWLQEDEEVDFMSPSEKEHLRKFREKRKAHYNEFLAAKMAKERLKNNDDEDEDEDDPDHDQAAEEAARNARYNATIAKLLIVPDQSGSPNANHSTDPKDSNQRKP